MDLTDPFYAGAVKQVGDKLEVLISDTRDGAGRLRFRLDAADIEVAEAAYRGTCSVMHALQLGVRCADAWSGASTRLHWGSGPDSGSFDYLADSPDGHSTLVDLKHCAGKKPSHIWQGGLRMWRKAKATLEAAQAAALLDDATEVTRAAAAAAHVCFLLWRSQCKRGSPAARCAVVRCAVPDLLAWDDAALRALPLEAASVRQAVVKWTGTRPPAAAPAAAPGKRDQLRQRVRYRKPPGSTRRCMSVPLNWAARVLIGKSSQAPDRVASKLKGGACLKPFSAPAFSKYKNNADQLWVRWCDLQRCYPVIQP